MSLHKITINLWLILCRLLPKTASKMRLFYNRHYKRHGMPRLLEIGPGPEILPGFERYNIVTDRHSHYIGDARDLSMFQDGEFTLIYASHVLEHIPWYQTVDTLQEWYRVLAKDGALEVWVPDGFKIAHAYVDACLGKNQDFMKDGWFRFNEEKDHNLWYSGRTYAYGDGKGNIYHPNWHCASFSKDYLIKLMVQAGFSKVSTLDSNDVRGNNHGWINLGIKGIK